MLLFDALTKNFKSLNIVILSLMIHEQFNTLPKPLKKETHNLRKRRHEKS